MTKTLEMMAKSIAWKRKYPDSIGQDDNQRDIQKNSFNRMFTAVHVNYDVDIFTKRIALKAASFVVCMKVFSGNQEIRWGSGFILECNTAENDKFECIVITSTSLFRIDHASNFLLDDLKVVVVLPDGKQCPSEIQAHDFHYNLAAIKFGVSHSMETARLRLLDDSMPTMTASEAQPFQLHPHSDAFRLAPGSRAIELGRFYDKNQIMIAPGVFSVQQCEFDCKDLLRSTCRITKCGIGGPMVNQNAEIIGINFFALRFCRFTPFLPSNIISKWWNHFQKFKVYCRPWLGVEVSNLYTVEVWTWENIIQKFPHVKEGIVVDEVAPNSPASSAKVLVDDIILEFDGEVVSSSLQFFNRTWDKVGKTVNLVVIRTTDNSPINLSITVANISCDQFNRWPLPGSG